MVEPPGLSSTAALERLVRRCLQPYPGSAWQPKERRLVCVLETEVDAARAALRGNPEHTHDWLALTHHDMCRVCHAERPIERRPAEGEG